jgi:hypothetical protein
MIHDDILMIICDKVSQHYELCGPREQPFLAMWSIKFITLLYLLTSFKFKNTVVVSLHTLFSYLIYYSRFLSFLGPHKYSFKCYS